MKKITFALLLLIGLSGIAQEKLTQNTIQGVLQGNQAQVVSLAEAFSEEQYDWRPMEGVSSVGEALLHIAGANYFLATKLGFAPPEDVDMMNLNKITGKQNIIDALKKSNEFVLDKVTMVESDSFNDEVDFGFTKMNKLSGLLIIMEHNGEHKGQLIAYARSNDVVPPWSK
ncbi:DinB family protein [Euzebyella marina]|uniref:DinB family protein n=1 Tax=Euzebyella marina TaxID=1761453 RepID=A0A3G2L3Z8_9FLAO|nr:DinB family protein [Euzebyella marina]AYN66941.1 DinB family protein [Euzebyella marina]MAU72383.1 damage-inducible protein DinB [Pseudozobellia sp.]MBG47192.1 damage-inducible protein DinB [Pseudozobellia sp.]|tara:strand:+ start:155 stop:667 length:513 start_codon:yes stop_codon:yes gene_type:complete